MRKTFGERVDALTDEQIDESEVVREVKTWVDRVEGDGSEDEGVDGDEEEEESDEEESEEDDE